MPKFPSRAKRDEYRRELEAPPTRRNDQPENAAWPEGVPARLTDEQLDQWETSALADHEAGAVWSVNPLAVLSVVHELRMYRDWIVTDDAGSNFDDKAPSGATDAT